jgi:hypothetical protein
MFHSLAGETVKHPVLDSVAPETAVKRPCLDDLPCPAKIPVGAPAEWVEGFARLSPNLQPCPGLRHWPEIYARAARFLQRQGEQAADLGWSTLELFGVHPELGTIRVDCCGALVLYAGGAVVDVTADQIRFERTSYRRGPGAQLGIPIWQCGRTQPEDRHD